jgi:hypothetical protein
MARFFSGIRGPITWFTVGLWIGTALLLIAVTFPTNSNIRFAITHCFVTGSTAFAFFGSAVTTALLCYEAVRLVELKLGLLHGRGRVVVYQPNAFDRMNRVMSKPILLLLLVSSVASLLISATIMFRNRSASPSVDSKT